MGNFGTYHTDIDAQTFRGLAISDPVAPFIVINENDSRSAWSFTMLHEFTHILLGQTAISGYDSEVEEERFCDSVAARFLLDPAELHEIEGAAQVDDLVLQIANFAAARNVSRKMVAYNLLQSGRINGIAYRNLNQQFDAERQRNERERKSNSDRKAGGPNYYMVRRHRLGNSLISLAGRMVSGGSLTTTKAGQVLGVKPTAVGRLIGSRSVG